MVVYKHLASTTSIIDLSAEVTISDDSVVIVSSYVLLDYLMILVNHHSITVSMYLLRNTYNKTTPYCFTQDNTVTG